MSVSHMVYGLRLGADRALPGLPLRCDSEAADVRIRLGERGQFPAARCAAIEPFHTRSDDSTRDDANLLVGMLLGEEYFGFFYPDGARFAVERQGREVWADWPENYTLEDACTYLLGPVMGFVLRLRGVTCLHASAIAVDDHAIVLAGFPGAGKSTTAAAFGRSGFSVIADDVVALEEDRERFLVPPGYPRVNLWPDSVRALFGSEEALPRITPTWDKRYLALGESGLGFASKPLPLGAIYVLGAREAALTDPVVEEITGAEAFTALVANTYLNYLLDREMRRREFDVLSSVVAQIPIRRVRAPAQPSALFALCEAIATDAMRTMGSIPVSATPGHV